MARLGGAAAPAARAAVLAAATATAVAGLTGCSNLNEINNVLDPGEMMRSTKGNLMVPVLPTLAAGLDEAEPEWVNARDVRQPDLKADTSDYVIGRNDLVSVSVSEGAGATTETVKTTRVSESGNISLPLIGTVKAAGLTEAELEKAIAQIYKDRSFIQNAQVAVTVVEQRQRTFSILGAVGRPGQFQIVQSDFRLLDAITLAGDIQIQGIENLYVIRKLGGNPDRPATRPAGATSPAAPGTGTTPPAGTGGETPRRPVDPLNPQGRADFRTGPVHLMLLADAPASDDTGETKKVLIDGKWVPVRGAGAAAVPTAPAGDAGTTPAGGATPAVTTPPAPATTTPPAPLPPTGGGTRVNDPLNTTGATGAGTAGTSGSAAGSAAGGTTAGGTGTAGKGFEFDAPQVDPDIETIRVPYGRLRKGEYQYNIVIRPNDTIVIPSPEVGEYYMGGHVQRPGVYSLTGRQITIKQAVISAGMIDPLGWPSRTEVVRRIGKDKELFVRVDLPKVFAGESPDIFLRPYDTVSVGTHIAAPFLAAIRGAFRFTYGFGFIYDRNFGVDENNNNSNRNTQ